MPAGPGSDPTLRAGPGETLDHIGGEWRIFQLRRGHRYSTDDLLTAWFACRTATDAALAVERHLDLGAGIGSVAMMVAWRLAAARIVAVEAQERSASLFLRSARYNGLLPRLDLRQGDLRDPALLPEGRAFQLVTGSPPYLPPGVGGVSAEAQKDQARFERRGGVEDYAVAAERALAKGGIFTLVHTWADAARVDSAAEGAGLLRWRTLPVLFREDRAPLIALYALRRPGECDAPVVLPPMAIRTAAGQRGEEYSRAREWMGFPP